MIIVPSVVEQGENSSFLQKLETSRAIALEIVATVAVQKGVDSADSIDLFRSDLDNYLALAKTKRTRSSATRSELAKRLSVLSEMAAQFAKKGEAEISATTSEN